MEYRSVDSGKVALAWRDNWGEFVVSKGHASFVRRMSRRSACSTATSRCGRIVPGNRRIGRITSLDALRRGHGYGRQLSPKWNAARRPWRETLLARDNERQCSRHLGVSLRRWRHVGLRLDALDGVRALKPAVPLVGENGIPLRESGSSKSTWPEAALAMTRAGCLPWPAGNTGYWIQ